MSVPRPSVYMSGFPLSFGRKCRPENQDCSGKPGRTHGLMQEEHGKEKSRNRINVTEQRDRLGFQSVSAAEIQSVGDSGVDKTHDQQHKNRNLHFKYFDASIFKKGTCHLKFTDEAVVDALNIYVGKHKGWLPPSYGKVSYDEMNAEEQAIIDDFQGKEQYAKVLANPSKYLFETSAMLALSSEKSEK